MHTINMLSYHVIYNIGHTLSALGMALEYKTRHHWAISCAGGSLKCFADHIAYTGNYQWSEM